MICDSCLDKGHYWFADDDEEIGPELEELIGLYAWCDMRRVYATGVGCECGCHEKEKQNGVSELSQGDGNSGGVQHTACGRLC